MTPDEHHRVKQLEQIAIVGECATEGCGGLLVVLWSPQDGKLMLRCGKDKAHRGIRHVSSRHIGGGISEVTKGLTIFYPEEDEVPLEYIANPKRRKRESVG